MTDRDRLIEVLTASMDKQYEKRRLITPQHTADDLLANGVVVLDTGVISPKNRPLITHFANMPINDVLDLVRAKKEGRLIVPPCKVGDTIYEVGTDGKIYQSKITSVLFDTNGIAFDYRAIGHTVFLTKEEAEEKLKELGK